MYLIHGAAELLLPNERWSWRPDQNGYKLFTELDTRLHLAA